MSDGIGRVEYLEGGTVEGPIRIRFLQYWLSVCSVTRHG